MRLTYYDLHLCVSDVLPGVFLFCDFSKKQTLPFPYKLKGESQLKSQMKNDNDVTSYVSK